MNLPCPKCLAESAIKLDLADGDTLSCPECTDDFTLTDVENLVNCWSKLLPWLRACPARQPAAEPAAP